MFFSFDGTDGVGKSTQIELFKNWLMDNGHEVVLCRDPGSSLLGERLRDLLLDKHDINIARRSEMFLYICLLYTSPSPRDRTRSRMPSSA